MVRPELELVRVAMRPPWENLIGIIGRPNVLRGDSSAIFLRFGGGGDSNRGDEAEQERQQHCCYWGTGIGVSVSLEPGSGLSEHAIVLPGHPSVLKRTESGP